ncbi:MAG: glycosyltransferase family 4 protein [Myxococcota bacterium]
MRVLHLVKTLQGAYWVMDQARILHQMGVDVHIALPFRTPSELPKDWKDSPATLHPLEADMPFRQPWRLWRILKDVRQLVQRVQPDLMHVHHVSTALLARWALGPDHPVRRIYQVAGPLHLEMPFYRALEISSAGSADVWVGSCQSILRHYLEQGVQAERLFLSYSGRLYDRKPPTKGTLRRMVDAQPDDIIVGNINLMYPPKTYLGHNIGIKCHEVIFEALAIAQQHNPRILGVFVGGPLQEGHPYEAFLHKLARECAGDRIRLTGRQPKALAPYLWADFDLCTHISLTESCGGVVEPLWQGIPVISSDVGGLPEVVWPNQTGWLVSPTDIPAIAQTLLHVLEHPEQRTETARRGQALVRTMFDGQRTIHEIFDIYRFLLGDAPRPLPFQPQDFLQKHHA